MTAETVRVRASEAVWAAVDDKGIRGRLYREDCDYVTNVVLASLADPAVVAGVAEVLGEHTGQGEACDCGAAREPGPGAPWSGWHADHVARAVVEWITGGVA